MNPMKAWNPMKLIPSLTEGTLTPLCPHSRDGELKPKKGSESAASLPMRSIGKPVMTSDCANAMPRCTDTMLPTIATLDSVEGPNEMGKKCLFCSGV